MKKELDEKLCKEFPLLYADRHKSMQETCMCWGFECGDGWFDIIYNLSKRLEALIQAMPEDEQKHYRAAQMKEKFGSIRFYMTAETPIMEQLISEAEDASEKTCEVCGEPGKLQCIKHWYKTVCDKHYEEWQQRRTKM